MSNERLTPFPQDWIPLTQQVPEYDRKVLVTAKGKDPEIAHLSSVTTGKGYTSYEFLQGYDQVWFTVTHWMYLPDTSHLI